MDDKVRKRFTALSRHLGSNSGESVNALKIMNDILAAHNLSWTDITFVFSSEIPEETDSAYNGRDTHGSHQPRRTSSASYTNYNLDEFRIHDGDGCFNFKALIPLSNTSFDNIGPNSQIMRFMALDCKRKIKWPNSVCRDDDVILWARSEKAKGTQFIEISIEMTKTTSSNGRVHHVMHPSHFD